MSSDSPKHVLRLLLSLSVVTFFLFCTQRDDTIGSRNNPFDAGGTNWEYTTPPEVTIRGGALWENFDHESEVGCIGVTIGVVDSNFPYDTVSGEFRGNGHPVTRLRFDDSLSETKVTLCGLLPKKTYRCTVIVNDLKGSADTGYVSVLAPSEVPPPAPNPSIQSQVSTISLTWDTVPGADHYILYMAQMRDGSFSPVDTINPRLPSGVAAVTVVKNAPGSLPVFYQVGAENSAGISICSDTLTGRALNASLPSPNITVSQGVYPDYISITASFRVTSEFRYVELFRARKQTGTFKLIDTISIPPTTGTLHKLSYNDSVGTGDTCWYRVAIIDSRERTGTPGSVSYGFTKRPSVPESVVLSIESDYLHLSWESVEGAAYYRIYRKSLAASELQLLDTTTRTEYDDTPAVTDTFCYVLSAVDTQKYEGMKSSVLCGRIRGLPVPENVTISTDRYIDRVVLSWSPVPGATGYIIERRSLTTGDSTTVRIDAGTDTTYTDTLLTVPAYRYRIAATDKRGPGRYTMFKRGSAITPPVPKVIVVDNVLQVAWESQERALGYLLYRGTDTANFVQVDSTTELAYADTHSFPGTFYYRLVLVTSQGLSIPGNFISVAIILQPPDMVFVKEGVNSVHLSWPEARYAERYRIYRSSTSSNFSLYAETNDTFFVDNITENTRYHYYVTSVIDTLESKPGKHVIAGRSMPPLAPFSFYVSGSFYYYNKVAWILDNNSSIPTGFYVYRSDGSSSTLQLYDSTTNLFYVDSVPDTARYYYAISAYNASGEGAKSTKVATKRRRPQSPSTVRVTRGDYVDYARISWPKVVDVPLYGVFRGPARYGEYPFVGATADTVFNDSSCETNTLFYYIVLSLLKDSIRGTINGVGSGGRLGPPESGAIEYVDGMSHISWEAGPFAANRYYIHRSSNSTGPFIKIDSTSSLNYVDRTPLTGGMYYKLSAKGLLETPLCSLTLEVHPPLPDVPEAISASKGTETGGVNVTWSSVSIATGYRLFRSPTYTFEGGGLLIGSTTTTAFIDTVEADSLYYYKVLAYNEFGESNLSEITATGFRTPSSVPASVRTPHILQDRDSIVIGWGLPSTSVGFTGYHVYRAPSSDGPFELQHITEKRRFSDGPPLSYPTSYWYRIAAYNQNGDGPFAVIEASRY